MAQILKKFVKNVMTSLKEFTLSPKEIKAVQSNVKARPDSNLIRRYTVKKAQHLKAMLYLL